MIVTWSWHMAAAMCWLVLLITRIFNLWKGIA